MSDVECQCGRISIGSKITEHRNWNPDCSLHGTESEWWNSPEQKAKREADNARLRDLQRRAREARRNSDPRCECDGKVHVPPCPWKGTIRG